jgi:hypothetical protein
MGVSLSVFKIKDYKKENLVGNGEITTLKGQLTFHDLELTDELGSSKSTLKLRNYDKANEIAIYDAIHFSATIKNPVRVFMESYEDYEDIQEDSLDIKPINKTLLFFSSILYLDFRIKYNFGLSFLS